MTDADLTRRARVEAWNGWIDDHRGHGSVTRELMAAWDAAWTAASAALSAELAEAKAENERLRVRLVAAEATAQRHDIAGTEARAALAALRARIEALADEYDDAIPGFVRRLRALAADEGERTGR